MNCFTAFIVGVARSQDSIQPLLGVVPVADKLDNSAPDDSFVDDSRHAQRLGNWQLRVVRMAVAGLDIVANRYFDLGAVQALASLGVVNSGLKKQIN